MGYISHLCRLPGLRIVISKVSVPNQEHISQSFVDHKLHHITSTSQLNNKSLRNLVPILNCNDCWPNDLFTNNLKATKIYLEKFHYRRKKGNSNEGQAGDIPKVPSNLNLYKMIATVGIFKSIFQSEEDIKNEDDAARLAKMSPIEKLIVKGVSNMLELKYHDANDLFHRALKIAQKEKDHDQEFLILTLLATSYFENDQLREAEKLFIALIKNLIDKNIERDNPALLELSLKLAAIYSKKPETHYKATVGFKYIIDTLTTNLHSLIIRLNELKGDELDNEQKNALALLGWTYDWFSKYLLSTNNYKDAIHYLKKALEISYVVLGPLHDQTLILLNDIGTTIAMSESPNEGRTFIQQAVDGAIESGSKELASFYLNLGLTNLRSNRFAEGKDYCEKSLKMSLENTKQVNFKEIMNLSKQCLKEYEECDQT